MKRIVNLLLVVALISLVVISCKKKDDEVDYANLPYAAETVDQGKANLEKTGQQVVSEMKLMGQSDGLVAATSLQNCLKTTTAVGSSVAFDPIKASNELKSGSIDLKGMASIIKSAASDTSFNTYYIKYKGVYTWNKDTKKWTKTGTADHIELLFPAKSTSTSNDGKLELTYSSKLSKVGNEQPLSLNCSVYVSSNKVLGYGIEITYDSNDAINYYKVSYSVTPFTFEATYSRNSSEVSMRYLFTDGSKTIFDYYVAVNGNFEQTDVAADDPVSVMTGANAYFQILDVKLAGRIDYKALNDELKKIKSNLLIPYTQQENDARVAAYNKYMKLVLYYTSTNQKIAAAEAYAVTTGLTNPIYNVEMRFVFADGSKGDLKSYFNTGFSTLKTEIDNAVEGLKGYDLPF